MGIVACPDCKGQVSQSAESCPHCGRPMGRARHDVVAGRQVVAVEQTAKRYKGRLLVYGLFLIVGVVLAILAGKERIPMGWLPGGIVMAFVGGIGTLATKAAIWWHHK